MRALPGRLGSVAVVRLEARAADAVADFRQAISWRLVGCRRAVGRPLGHAAPAFAAPPQAVVLGRLAVRCGSARLRHALTFCRAAGQRVGRAWRPDPELGHAPPIPAAADPAIVVESDAIRVGAALRAPDAPLPAAAIPLRLATGSLGNACPAAPLLRRAAAAAFSGAAAMALLLTLAARADPVDASAGPASLLVGAGLAEARSPGGSGAAGQQNRCGESDGRPPPDGDGERAGDGVEPAVLHPSCSGASFASCPPDRSRGGNRLQSVPFVRTGFPARGTASRCRTGRRPTGRARERRTSRSRGARGRIP